MNRLKKLRLAHGYKSQKDLADALFVNQTAVSQWERGVTMPSGSMLLKLSNMYGVSIDYLLGNTEQSEKATIDVIDDDLREYLDELRSRPEKKMLFSVTKNATKGQIEAIVKMIEEMQGDK